MKWNVFNLKKGDILYSSVIAFLGLVVFTGLVNTIQNVQQFGWEYTKIFYIQGSSQYYFEKVVNQNAFISLGFFVLLIFILLYSYKIYRFRVRGLSSG